MWSDTDMTFKGVALEPARARRAALRQGNRGTAAGGHPQARGPDFLAVAERVEAAGILPMSDEEIQRQVNAVRKAKRQTRARRR
jgi:hypothetical protein